MITIKTGAWSAKLPADHIKIGISRGTPRFRIEPGWRRYTPLNPGPWLTAPDFTARYQELLSRLDAQQVHEDIMRIADGRIPVLCCFERVGSGQWCHRSQAASWLAQGLGIAVPELGFEGETLHPLRPPKMLIP
jgi:hypothetical protein